MMNNYEKIKKIGEGSFGKALLVKHKQSGLHYVMKEINISKMATKERREARKEVEVLSKLKHPYIVSYVESFEEAGSLYIIMDYCEGGDLYKRINSQRGILFSEEQVIDWFIQISLAIKHVHDRKILHRDLKSSNIFLTKDGTVKLGDFGIARVLNSTMELAKTCIGTPYYLSPEMCENRPYNNKSDIWALGCVLYEVTTLKHAFEAGNMKNLVLKIIRGSYPPVSPKYSYELRSMVASLFKRNPKDRPTINTVLKKPFISKRLPKFLSEEMIMVEFSHTVLHRGRPPVPRPVPVPIPDNKQPVLIKKSPDKPPVPAPGRYDPAAIYGAPLPARRPSNGINKRPNEKRISAGSDKEKDLLGAKRKELMDKEKERRDQQQKSFKEQQQKLCDKQSMARMHKDREEGWLNVLGGSSSLPRNNGKDDISAKIGAEKQAKAPVIGVVQPLRDDNRYEHYNKFLQQAHHEREDRLNQPPVVPTPSPTPAPAPQPGAGWPRDDAVRRFIHKPNDPVIVKNINKSKDAAKQANVDKIVGEKAAQKAKHVEDFLQRRREAGFNRARGDAWLVNQPYQQAVGGVKQRPSSAQQPPPRRTPVVELRPISAACPPVQHPIPADKARNNDESEYLDRLRQIRIQNFNERRAVREKVMGVPTDQHGHPPAADQVGDPRYDPDARKKKIEALKSQADARAAQLREHLEKKRREAYDREKQKLAEAKKDHQNKIENVPIPSGPSLPMTAALRNVGAMFPSSAEDGVKPENKLMELKREKTEILKRLNEKMRPTVEHPPVAVGDRKNRWEGVKRSSIGLGDMPLETTASNMEATVSEDNPVILPVSDDGGARKRWGTPPSTIIRALQEKTLSDGTVVLPTLDPSPSSGEGGDSVTVPVSSGTGSIQSKTMTINTHVTVDTVLQQQQQQQQHSQDNTAADNSPNVPATSGGQVDPSVSERPAEDSITTEQEDSSKITDSLSFTKPLIAWSQLPPTHTDERPVAPPRHRKVNDETMTLTSVVVESENVEGITDPSPLDGGQSAVTDPSVSQDQGVTDPSTGEGQNVSNPSTGGGQSVSDPSTGEGQGVTDLSVSECQGVTDPSTGASGGQVLFNKVELAESLCNEDEPVLDDVEIEDIDYPSHLSPRLLKTGSPFIFTGLRTGLFDTNITILRTCSMPDLTQLVVTAETIGLFHSQQYNKHQDDNSIIIDNSDHHDNNPDNNRMRTEDNITIDTHSGNEPQITMKHDNSTDTGVGESEEQSADGDDGGDFDSDEEDLRSMRESMMSLLHDDDNEGDDNIDEGSKRLTLTDEGSKRLTLTDEGSKRLTLTDDSEEICKGDTIKLSPSKSPPDQTVPPHASTSTSVFTITDSEGDGEGAVPDEDEDVPTIVNEDWDSDESDDDDETSGGPHNVTHTHSTLYADSVYTRLEVMREQLESVLGCDLCIDAYKAIQAIHEDEEESMDEGPKIIRKILGDDKMYLYPKILQLVMADGVYMEGNE